MYVISLIFIFELTFLKDNSFSLCYIFFLYPCEERNFDCKIKVLYGMIVVYMPSKLQAGSKLRCKQSGDRLKLCKTV